MLVMLNLGKYVPLADEALEQDPRRNRRPHTTVCDESDKEWLLLQMQGG